MEKRRQLQNQGIEYPDFLGALLSFTDENGNSLDDRDIRWCVHDLIAAGNETTATSIAAALALLAASQDIQKALREELVSVLGDGGIPGAADLGHLPLLDAIVHETLRLYPAVSFFVRKCVEGPDVLNGYTIKKGGIVMMSPFAMQRSAEFWTNPEEFRPSRFLPGGEWEGAQNGGSVPKMAWIPFGAGQHSCIGGRIALLEASMLLATLVQTFRFRPMPQGFGKSGINADGSLDIKYYIMLELPNGLFVEVERL